MSIILYRSLPKQIGCQDEELKFCQDEFTVYEGRGQLCCSEKDQFVIGRYSVLPYYGEVYFDLLNTSNLRLINSPQQHKNIADITNWCYVLEEFTPKTYTQWGDLNDGKWIVKGRTNSKKSMWTTHMFADGRESLINTIRNLLDDTFISDQGLVVREYIPLKTLGHGVTGLPITNEYRFFFVKDKMVASGFYWSEHPDYFQETPKEAIDFAMMVSKVVVDKIDTNFYVLDVAEKEDGGWILIEMNDGQQSGTCCIEPDLFYSNLRKTVDSFVDFR